jgi:hypothetical protein
MPIATQVSTNCERESGGRTNLKPSHRSAAPPLSGANPNLNREPKEERRSAGPGAAVSFGCCFDTYPYLPQQDTRSLDEAPVCTFFNVPSGRLLGTVFPRRLPLFGCLIEQCFPIPGAPSFTFGYPPAAWENRERYFRLVQHGHRFRPPLILKLVDRWFSSSDLLNLTVRPILRYERNPRRIKESMVRRLTPRRAATCRLLRYSAVGKAEPSVLRVNIKPEYAVCADVLATHCALWMDCRLRS